MAEYPPLVPDPDLARAGGRAVRAGYENVIDDLGKLAYAPNPDAALILMRKFLKNAVDLVAALEAACTALGLPYDEARAGGDIHTLLPDIIDANYEEVTSHE